MQPEEALAAMMPPTPMPLSSSLPPPTPLSLPTPSPMVHPGMSMHDDVMPPPSMLSYGSNVAPPTPLQHMDEMPHLPPDQVSEHFQPYHTKSVVQRNLLEIATKTADVNEHYILGSIAVARAGIFGQFSAANDPSDDGRFARGFRHGNPTNSASSFRLGTTWVTSDGKSRLSGQFFFII